MNMFQEKIDDIIQNHLIATDSFYALTCATMGINPIDIAESLKRLYKSNRISSYLFETLISDAARCCNIKHKDNKQLPVPHWLDFDWRFSYDGIIAMRKHVDIIAKNSSLQNIAFIGAPTMFKHFCANPIPGMRYFLIDFNAKKHIKNMILPEDFNIVSCNVNYEMDMTYDMSKINADIVIMDPPWYNEYYYRFFEICTHICKSGCTILAVCPPELTRETITEERHSLYEYLLRNGFNGFSIDENIISYDTPPFEQNVFKANKINNYSRNWRTGSLLQVTFAHRSSPCSLLSNSCITGGSWFEKQIGNLRIKLSQERKLSDGDAFIKLSSLFPLDIYPSVSRRFCSDKPINVWTSGNRVFYCSNIPVFVILIEQHNRGNIVDYFKTEYEILLNASQKSDILETCDKLDNLVCMEMIEYGDWG